MSEAGKDESHEVFLGLGSNIQPEQYLPRAIAKLRQVLEIVAVSSAWETPAVGSSGPDFLNAAVQARTGLPVEDLRVKKLRPIEKSLGRVRTADPNAPRTIDIDILIYDGEIIEEELWDQAHVCLPLSELIPDYAHPLKGETMGSAAQRLTQTTSLRRRSELIAMSGK